MTKTIAIVGRPNVGKSTLFNKICRQRRAIVADLPGITRDRIYSRAEWNGHRFEVVDTGGLVPREKELILQHILSQAREALEESDLILFLVNGREGLTVQDEEVADFIRPYSARTILVVNQLDPPVRLELTAPFFQLGAESLVALSAEHNAGLGELLDLVCQRLFGQEREADSTEEEEEESNEIRVAIVGRPNVGKSTLVNSLLGKNRVIVSPIAGTTRDAVDSVIRKGSGVYRLIDTAGIRRKGKTSGQIESLSVIMAQKSLRRADVALLLLDGLEGVTKLDAEIGGMALESGFSLFILGNKADLFPPQRKEELGEELDRRMKFAEFAPRLFLSARENLRADQLFSFIERASKARKTRISTSRLNNRFLPHVKEHLTQSGHLNLLPANFITQASVSPPTFVLFIKGKSMHFSLERFVQNQLRKQFGFYAAPIRLVVRKS